MKKEKYLFDTHIHTSESSYCGRVCAEEIVKMYKSLGYDGLVITDHVNGYTFDRHGGTSKEKVDAFLKGYKTAKKFETEDFKIILGMEIRFLDHENDYLVYGFDEEFLYTHDIGYYKCLEDFRPVVEENGLIIFQAHPFREDMTIIDQDLLDGIEIYNGHGNHDSRNEIAYMWAKRFGHRMLSGSDFHGNTDKEPGGVYFDEPVNDSFDVARLLRENKYTLKIMEK